MIKVVEQALGGSSKKGKSKALVINEMDSAESAVRAMNGMMG